MSTTPFIQVEGVFALPYIRPLGMLPATFGREWALTPSHLSWRSELHALYAAIMRTMCLSAEAFLAVARWDRDRSPFPLPPAPVAAPITPKTPADATAARATSPRKLRKPVVLSRRSPPYKRTKLAVAIGCAALLAWIVASHAPSDSITAATKAVSRSNTIERQDASQRTANARAEHEHATVDAVQQPSTRPVAPASQPIEHAPATEAVAPGLANRTAQAPAQAPVMTAVNEIEALRANVPARAQPDFGVRAKAAAPARLVQREARHNVRAVKLEPYREGPPVMAHRSRESDLEADRYAPRHTRANSADDYASLIAYAKTYTAERTSNRPAVPVDSTDWVNHVSQRRVTEVPDQFAK